MISKERFQKLYSNNRGAVAVLVGITIVVIVMFAALAIDMGHLYVVKNELQNAADAGALAAGQELYTPDGTAINASANQVGYDAARANLSEKIAVDVNWTTGNAGDVQRGHWNPTTKTFTPNDTLIPVDLWNVDTETLNNNINFINAVKVTARRETTPAASFLAGIFGYQNFTAAADAISYIGFAGTLEPQAVDLPIAICLESILKDGNYSCERGRMINSGQNVGSETARWTNYTQPCDTVNQNNTPLTCGSMGNPDPIMLNQGIGTTNGEVTPILSAIESCWKNSITGLDTNGDSIPDKPWEVTLPVVDCTSANTCSTARGAVVVKIVWITGNGNDPQYNNVPTRMTDSDTGLSYNCTDTSTQAARIACWNNFADTFGLKNLDGTRVNYLANAFYFIPSCKAHIPTGSTGGINTGILAKRPVLVE